MKKLLVVSCMAMLVIGLLFIAGCGEAEKAENGEDVVVVDTSEPVSEGIYGEYVHASDNGKISLYKDGTFTTGSGDEGAFKLDGQSLELTYENDSSRTETWSVAVALGKVAAITNPEGQQYTKQQD